VAAYPAQPLQQTLSAIPYLPLGTQDVSISYPGWSVGQSQWNWTTGVVQTISDLIASPADGTVYYPGGRLFPAITPNGSTCKVQFP
jgi:hypothetical protein